MDRDNRWDRVELAYKALTEGEGVKAADPVAAVSRLLTTTTRQMSLCFLHVIEKDGKPVCNCSGQRFCCILQLPS